MTGVQTCALPISPMSAVLAAAGIELHEGYDAARLARLAPEEAVALDDGPLDSPPYKAAREAYRLNPSPANRVRLNQSRRR